MFDRTFVKGVAVGVASLFAYEAIKWGIGRARERMLLMPQRTDAQPPATLPPHNPTPNALGPNARWTERDRP